MPEKEMTRQFLMAWLESQKIRDKMVPLLADTLGLGVDNLYYNYHISSCLGETSPWGKTDQIENTSWRIFFHGLADCDLIHLEDGRFVNIHFGPGGRYDTFFGWGLLKFVMSCRPPWYEFKELKEYLADKPPPYNYRSGDHSRMVEITRIIEGMGVFEIAEKELAYLKMRHKKQQENGSWFQESLPPPYDDLENKAFWDMMVCEAQVPGVKGQKLFTGGFNHKYFDRIWADYMAGLY